MNELRLYPTIAPDEENWEEQYSLVVEAGRTGSIYIIGALYDDYAGELIDYIDLSDESPNIQIDYGFDYHATFSASREPVWFYGNRNYIQAWKISVIADSDAPNQQFELECQNFSYIPSVGAEPLSAKVLLTDISTKASSDPPGPGPEPDPPTPWPAPMVGMWGIKWNDEMQSTDVYHWSVQEKTNQFPDGVYFISNGEQFTSIKVDTDGVIKYGSKKVYASEQQVEHSGWNLENKNYQIIYVNVDPRQGPFPPNDWANFLEVNTSDYGIIEPLQPEPTPTDPTTINIDLSLSDDPTTMPKNIPAKVFRELLLCKGAMKFGGIYVGTGKYKIIQIDYDGCKVNYRIPEVKIVEPLNNAPHRLVYKDGEVQWETKKIKL